MITPRNVVRHELIGLDVLVVGASNPASIGITGQIVDETRNMLIVNTRIGIKKIQKDTGVFRITLPDGIVVDVRGSALVMAPEKRVNLHKKI
jgi:ribonuclease P protein subunit POP4